MSLFSLLALSACIPTDWEARDAEAWDAWEALPIQFSGQVFGPAGPMQSADVQLGDLSTTTDAEGRFVFADLPRHNTTLRITAAGHHPIVRPVWLTRVAEIEEVESTYTLDPILTTESRLLFGGDVMFGRRFVDVDGITPRDQPYPERTDAIVPRSDPGAGAADVLRRIQPLLASADLTSVNFESAFVRTPNTPHPEKPFVFYSDPATLPALPAAGIDFLGMGNNHVYDYLQDGLRQTLDSVEALQMPHAGAGTTPQEAWSPWRTSVRDVPLAYFAATSIDGWRWDPSVNYVADATKGGAANLQDAEDMASAIGAAVGQGDRTILQVHTGVEYAHGPTERVREHVYNGVSSGADLVIGHHPHTAQGFSEVEGVFVAWSLGNLAFDGLRLETMLGAMVEVDLGSTWTDARVYPVYLEDYRPRMFVGPPASRALRQLSEFSEGLIVVEEEGIGRILRDADVEWERRTLTLPFTADEDGIAVIDLRDHAGPEESMLRFDTDAPTAQLRLGRDLMGHSQFEDEDVDDDLFEVARWDHTPASSFPCRTARTGVGALCSVRSSTDLDVSVMPFRNRIRVFGDAEGSPEKNVSVLGWQRADGSGEVNVRLEVHASFGETVFGEEVIGTLPGGTFDWSPFRFDYQLPDDLTPDNNPEINPRALRLFLDHQIPRVRGAGQLALDDLAIVGWSNTPESPPVIRTRPHPSDFLKISAPPGDWTATIEVGRPRRSRP